MDRRRFLLSAVGAGTVVVAGCSGGGDGSNPDTESDETTDDESDQPSNTITDENGGQSGTTTDDGDGQPGGTTTTDQNDGQPGGTTTTDQNGGQPGDDETPAGPQLGENQEWVDSFVAEFTFEGVGSQTIYYNGNNYRQVVETDQGTIEFYNVGGTLYQVTSGGCFATDVGEVPGGDTPVDPTDEEAVLGDQLEVTPSGRESIDGEQTYVYEYQTQGRTVTVYVSVESGYARRVEFAEGHIDYHSWGELDPIEPPAGCS